MFGVGSRITAFKLHKYLQTIRADVNNTNPCRLSELMSLVGGTGDIDKQIDGIHENLLMLKIREANFTKLADSLEWFTFYDIVGMPFCLRHYFKVSVCSTILFTPLFYRSLYLKFHYRLLDI